jgi:competence protein ComFC
MAQTLRLQPALDNLFRRAVDFLFPPLCLLCDDLRKPPDPWLCETCKNDLRENNRHRDPCPVCAMNRSRGDCACSTGWRHPFENVHALLDFDPLVQACMHQVKYKGRKRFARYLGGFLFDLLPPVFLSDIDAILPIPLHPLRQRKRGYNQSLLFALGIVDRHPGVMVLQNTLIRVRKTTTQTALDKEQRERNMRGAFVVNEAHCAAIAQKRLLLLDDVVTTGATTASAAQVLLDAGCAKVTVLAMARD